MGDLVKRLRSREAYYDPDTWTTLLDEAAKRIEELEKEIGEIDSGEVFYGVCPECGCGGAQ